MFLLICESCVTRHFTSNLLSTEMSPCTQTSITANDQNRGTTNDASLPTKAWKGSRSQRQRSVTADAMHPQTQASCQPTESNLGLLSEQDRVTQPSHSHEVSRDFLDYAFLIFLLRTVMALVKRLPSMPQSLRVTPVICLTTLKLSRLQQVAEPPSTLLTFLKRSKWMQGRKEGATFVCEWYKSLLLHLASLNYSEKYGSAYVPPGVKNFLYSLKTLNSNLRAHLKTEHNELYTVTCQEQRWPYLTSKSSQPTVGEECKISLPPFSSAALLEYLVHFIVADDQVSL